MTRKTTTLIALTFAAITLWPAAAQDVSSTTFKARARVTNRVINRVEALVFGDNIEWTNSGMGFWLPEEGKLDERLVAELREAGITHLRYPGGTLSDYFDWRKAVSERRQPIPNPFSSPVKGVPEYPHFGPGEFKKLCEELGIPGTITLNAGTGTPADAAGFVQYCRDEGLPVTAFAVGNEVYMSNAAQEDVPSLPVAKTPEQYVEFYLECLKAIDETVLGTKLGAIGLHDTGLFPLNRHPNWMEVVLSRIGEEIDFIDVHDGYAPVLRSVGFDTSRVYDDDAFAECMLAAPEYVRGNIEATKADIAEFVPGGGHDVGIHITEYGPLVYPFRGDDKEKLADMAWNISLAGALYQACLYHVFLAEPKITSANHLPLCQQGFGALIAFTGDYPDRVIWRNVVFYVFQMYRRMAGRNVLAVEVDSPTFSTKAMGIVPALDEVHYLDVAAFHAPDNTRLTVFLVNRNIRKDAIVDMDFETDLEGGRYAVESITELTADSYIAANTPEQPHRITPVTRSSEQGRPTDRLVLKVLKHSLLRVDLSGASSGL